MTPDYSNKLLAERYYLLRRIGYGGMATVYEAVDRELNKQVAVKILNPHYASQADYLARFRQEAREAARIRHENLVDVTDQGSTPDGLAYFVMEFLRGETLQTFLHPGEDESRPVPWRLMVSIVAQVCDALQHAHEHGLIHRDIKPGNIVLLSRRSGEFRVKVLDLGIAKVLQGHRDPRAPPTTRASQGTPGTPEYMSPEQVRGTPDACPQTDLYAVGVMMYRMLTGTLPFYSELSPYDVMEQHCKQLPEPPRKRAPSLEIPEALEREVMRALAKRPEDRQASAQELADTLRALEAFEARRERMLREDDEAHTLQYQVSADPPHRTTARLLSYMAAGLGGMTLSTTLFMVFLLLPFLPSYAGDASSHVVSSGRTRSPHVKPPAPAPDPETPPPPEPVVTKPVPLPLPPVPEVSPVPVNLTGAEKLDVETTTGGDGTSGPASTEDTGDTPPEATTADPIPPNPDPVSDPPPPPLAMTAEKQLANFLRTQKHLLDRRCGPLRIFSLEQVPVSFELAPPGGLPVMVAVAKVRRSSPFGKCVAATLRRIEFPALDKTTFKNVLVSF